MKIIVANYGTVEIAHALSLRFESVVFSDNSRSVLRVAAQKFVPQVFHYTKAARSREKKEGMKI